MPFIPHTPEDIAAMLATAGVGAIEDLFDEIPKNLRNVDLQRVPSALTEMDLSRLMSERAAQNSKLVCFAGAGAYEHFIPAAIWDIVGRGEFMTAYTPYQAEASQGTLQLLYEFQSMIAELTGMDVANASLYDGATALGEAILMAHRLCKRNNAHQVLLPRTVNPAYRKVAKTLTRYLNIEMVDVDYDPKTGIIDADRLNKNPENIFALVIPQPNFFGKCEEADKLTAWARQHDIKTIAVVNPTAMALLQPPGTWAGEGVDIVVGDGQPLGVPLSFGGPYFGFLSTRLEHVRQVPGRLIGATVDADGKRGYTLTLQAREQHIRRAKATSNICTNQGLLVSAATVYMSLMGATGLEKIAEQCWARAQELVKALTEVEGVIEVFDGPQFHETVIRVPVNVQAVLKECAKEGILGGVALGAYYPELQDCILVAATEMRSHEEIMAYKTVLKKVITRLKSGAKSEPGQVLGEPSTYSAWS
jgi:glycine dehydrogenase subunit 1